jgi:hypothetical protein
VTPQDEDSNLCTNSCSYSCTVGLTQDQLLSYNCARSLVWVWVLAITNGFMSLKVERAAGVRDSFKLTLPKKSPSGWWWQPSHKHRLEGGH